MAACAWAGAPRRGRLGTKEPPASPAGLFLTQVTRDRMGFAFLILDFDADASTQMGRRARLT
ncbi:hypothetical protein CDEST_11145 [Colletotrichum destructivum]|uniref:Uncharacterized protein n=1 Tax=Colletotrichum destructivum TaxID=34406 RepID=A0AAX4ISB5_9PEZI|nr:hypothetical protein CDEST_11145 [Colletotrichum destructivum]